MKERLTGALILVALLVILVPEILPGPVAERSTTDAEPSAAADGPPLRSYSMELGGAGRAVEADQSALAPQSAAPPAPVAAAPPVEDQGKPDVPSSAVAVPAPSADTANAAVAADAPVAAGGWWVQLGVFSQAANAQRLVQSLTKAGFRAQLSPMRASGKDMYRVRAGPVGDRAAAEALRARLSEAGHKGTLVAP